MVTLSETLYPEMPLEVRTTSPIQCSRTVHSIKKPAGSFIAVYPETAFFTLLTPGLVRLSFKNQVSLPYSRQAVAQRF